MLLIKIDYFIEEGGYARIMHHTITEEDIMEDLKQKFKDGQLSCPMHFNRDKCKVDFVIDSVTN